MIFNPVTLWKKYFSNKPWALYDYSDLGPSVVDCNKAFLINERSKEEIRANKLEEQIKLEAVAKEQQLKDDIIREEQIKLESEPKLTVIHSGIEVDGRIKLELDWNDAMIKQLQDNGFFGENEEEIIHRYLISLTNEAFGHEQLPTPGEEEDIMEPLPKQKPLKRNRRK